MRISTCQIVNQPQKKGEIPHLTEICRNTYKIIMSDAIRVIQFAGVKLQNLGEIPHLTEPGFATRSMQHLPRQRRKKRGLARVWQVPNGLLQSRF